MREGTECGRTDRRRGSEKVGACCTQETSPGPHERLLPGPFGTLQTEGAEIRILTEEDRLLHPARRRCIPVPRRTVRRRHEAPDLELVLLRREVAPGASVGRVIPSIDNLKHGSRRRSHPGRNGHDV